MYSLLPRTYRDVETLTPPGMNTPSIVRPLGGVVLEPGLVVNAAGSSRIDSLMVPVRCGSEVKVLTSVMLIPSSSC